MKKSETSLCRLVPTPEAYEGKTNADIVTGKSLGRRTDIGSSLAG
jgi:hypothetical protein